MCSNFFASQMGSPDICKVLVGNKTDLEKDRAVPTDRANKVWDWFAQSRKLKSLMNHSWLITLESSSTKLAARTTKTFLQPLRRWLLWSNSKWMRRYVVAIFGLLRPRLNFFFIQFEKHSSLQRAHSWHKEPFKKQSWCACWRWHWYVFWISGHSCSLFVFAV